MRAIGFREYVTKHPSLVAWTGLVLVGISAGLFVYTEAIGAGAVLAGVAGLAVLAGVWGATKRRPLLMVTTGLVIVVLYTWSLGPPSGMTIVVRQVGTRLVAHVDGQTFSQGGHMRRIGLYSASTSQYIVASDLGHPAAGGGPIAALAEWSRFVTPGPAWTDIALGTGSRMRSMELGAISRRTNGSWSLNPRGELAGQAGSVAWVTNGGGSHPSPTVFKATLMRPDGTQGMVFTDPSGRTGVLLVLRMDHRDARFYYWKNGAKGDCTCSRPTVFPVQTVPMIQRVLRFFLPSLIMAMMLILIGWLAVACTSWLWLARGNRSNTSPPEDEDSVGRTGPASKGGRTDRSVLPAWAATAVGVLTACLGVVSAALIALNVNQTLPTIEDTSTYIFQAKTFDLGRLWNPIPAVYHSFALTFTIRFHGHWFGKYPPGWPLLLAIGQFFDKGWFVTPVVGGVSLLILFLLGREMYSPWIGALAAVLALSSPFFLSMAGSLLSQSATWMWCGLFAYLAVFWFRRAKIVRAVDWTFPRDRWPALVGAGLAVGMAFATRQLDTVTLTIPFFLILLRKPLSLIWVATGAATPVVLFALYNFLLTGNATGSGYQQAFTYDRLGFGAHVGGPTAYNAGFDLARGIWNIAYDLEHFQMGLFGWPFLFALALVAVPFVAWKANIWDWLLVLACACVVGSYACYWASGVTGGFPRYWFGMVPFLALLAARGVEILISGLPSAISFRRVNGRLQSLVTQESGSAGVHQPLWARSVVPAVFLAVMMFFDVHEFMPANVLYYRNPEGAVVAAVKAAGIHNALIFQEQSNSQDSQFEVTFSQNSPSLNGNIIWAIDRGRKYDRLAMQAHPNRSYYRMNWMTLTRIHLSDT